MKKTLQTRWLLWKKQRISLLFWLIFPVVMTIFVLTQITSIQDDVQIPIGIVMEDNSKMADDLFQKLDKTPHIRPIVLTEREAKQQLAKHELDSLFIIHKNYANNIEKGNRNQLVSTYQTDLSFAYAPVRETFISYVQQDYTRAKTVQTIQQMKQAYEISDDWLASDIVNRSKEIEEEQQLLAVNFAFAASDVNNEAENKRFIDPWSLWALSTLLATFMLFDWVIKEKQSPVMKRLAYSQWSLKKFLWNNFLLYTGLLVIIDFITIISFASIFQEIVTVKLLSALMVYRLTINLTIFLMSQLFRTTFTYYAMSFAIALFATIFSGIIIPVQGQILPYIHPVVALREQSIFNSWLIISIIWFIGWSLRKGEKYA